jgi:hypothetical protein
LHKFPAPVKGKAFDARELGFVDILLDLSAGFPIEADLVAGGERQAQARN